MKQEQLTILLLHGNPDRRETWWCSSCSDRAEGLATLLEKGLSRRGRIARCVAEDLPGFGAQAAPTTKAGWSLTAFAEWLRRDGGALSADRATGGEHAPLVVVGHSHGGAVAFEFACLFPELVSQLVLLAPVGARAHGSYRLLGLRAVRPLLALAVAAARRSATRRLAKLVVGNLAATAYAPDPVPPHLLTADFELLARTPEILFSMQEVVLADPCRRVSDRLRELEGRRIPFRTLVLHGSEDRLVPPKYSESYQRIPGCERVILPGGGHMMHQTRSSEVAERMLAWLQVSTANVASSQA